MKMQNLTDNEKMQSFTDNENTKVSNITKTINRSKYRNFTCYENSLNTFFKNAFFVHQGNIDVTNTMWT